jgi:DinB superfamily
VAAAAEHPMPPDLRDRDLSTVLAEARRLGDEMARAFGSLSAQQVNWKPSEAEWSIGQCFDHLVVSNRGFFPIVEAVLQGRRHPRLWERVPLLPRIFGRLLIATLRPDSGRKVEARPAFRPSRSEIDPGIVTRFLEQHDRLLGLMDASGRLDLDRIVVTSPVSRLVTYSLMDAYRVIVVHEQNHLLQARRVRESPGFPGPAAHLPA